LTKKEQTSAKRDDAQFPAEALACPNCGGPVFYPDRSGHYRDYGIRHCYACGLECYLVVEADNTHVGTTWRVEEAGQHRCDGSCGKDRTGAPCYHNCERSLPRLEKRPPTRREKHVPAIAKILEPMGPGEKKKVVPLRTWEHMRHLLGVDAVDISDAQRMLRERLLRGSFSGGLPCPQCTRLMAVYQVHFNWSMGTLCMAYAYQHSRQTPEQDAFPYLDWRDVIYRTPLPLSLDARQAICLGGGAATHLRYYGILRAADHQDGEARAALYALSPFGLRFALEQVRVKPFLWVYLNQVLNDDDPEAIVRMRDANDPEKRAFNWRQAIEWWRDYILP